MGPSSPPPGWADSWQRSWDRLEDALVGERGARIAALLDVVEAVAGPAPTVVDLGCGPGSVTRRLLDRLPRARCLGVDVDPVLLTLASATFAADGRVRLVRADLRDPTWADALPERRVDAVVTATALHWLAAGTVTRLYRDLATLIRPGGVFAHAEQMPLGGMPRLGPALAAVEAGRRPGPAAGRRRWDAWWRRVAGDPHLAAAAVERRAVFAAGYPAEEFSPPAEWHLAALADAGFTEAGVVWRSGQAGVVAALR